MFLQFHDLATVDKGTGLSGSSAIADAATQQVVPCRSLIGIVGHKNLADAQFAVNDVSGHIDHLQTLTWLHLRAQACGNERELSNIDSAAYHIDTTGDEVGSITLGSEMLRCQMPSFCAIPLTS